MHRDHGDVVRLGRVPDVVEQVGFDPLDQLGRG
jgi:hypothetical protein